MLKPLKKDAVAKRKLRNILNKLRDCGRRGGAGRLRAQYRIGKAENLQLGSFQSFHLRKRGAGVTLANETPIMDNVLTARVIIR